MGYIEDLRRAVDAAAADVTDASEALSRAQQAYLRARCALWDAVDKVGLDSRYGQKGTLDREADYPKSAYKGNEGMCSSTTPSCKHSVHSEASSLTLRLQICYNQTDSCNERGSP